MEKIKCSRILLTNILLCILCGCVVMIHHIVQLFVHVFCRLSCLCRRKQSSECVCQIINDKACVKRVGLLNTSYWSRSNVRVIK